MAGVTADMILICRVCMEAYGASADSPQAPISSFACGHSQCRRCVEGHLKALKSSDPRRVWLRCPFCQENKAFTPSQSNNHVNYLAIELMQLLKSDISRTPEVSDVVVFEVYSVLRWCSTWRPYGHTDVNPGLFQDTAWTLAPYTALLLLSTPFFYVFGVLWASVAWVVGTTRSWVLRELGRLGGGGGGKCHVPAGRDGATNRKKKKNKNVFPTRSLTTVCTAPTDPRVALRRVTRSSRSVTVSTHPNARASLQRVQDKTGRIKVLFNDKDGSGALYIARVLRKVDTGFHVQYEGYQSQTELVLWGDVSWRCRAVR
jgi:hypothetical protein